MSVPSFDILAATRSLESTGVTRAQAERIADTVQRAIDVLIASLATKEDLDTLRKATHAAIALLSAAIDTLRTEMKADMATHRTETQAAIDRLSAAIDNLCTEMKAVKADMVTKADMATHRAQTKADLEAMKAELFRALWLQSIGILTGIGVLLTLFRIF